MDSSFITFQLVLYHFAPIIRQIIKLSRKDVFELRNGELVTPNASLCVNLWADLARPKPSHEFCAVQILPDEH